MLKLTGIAVLALSLTACAPTTSSSSGDSDTKPAAQPAQQLSPIQQVRADIKDALGDSNRDDVQRLGSVTIRGRRLVVHWAINDNISEGYTRKGGRIDTKDILTAVRDDEGQLPRMRAVEVIGTFVLVDRYGKESEDKVVDATYSRRVMDRIQYDAVDVDSMWLLADVGYTFIHPAFR